MSPRARTALQPHATPPEAIRNFRIPALDLDNEPISSTVARTSTPTVHTPALEFAKTASTATETTVDGGTTSSEAAPVQRSTDPAA